jgi:hypothetical protein
MLIDTCRPVSTNRCRVVCRQRGRQQRVASQSDCSRFARGNMGLVELPRETRPSHIWRSQENASIFPSV